MQKRDSFEHEENLAEGFLVMPDRQEDHPEHVVRVREAGTLVELTL